jgi:hypothetical protein
VRPRPRRTGEIGATMLGLLGAARVGFLHSGAPTEMSPPRPAFELSIVTDARFGIPQFGILMNSNV